jgi:hypothetical protein
MGWKIGDRAKSNPDIAGIAFTGTVVWVSDYWIHVERDDGAKGSGHMRSWRCDPCEIEPLVRWAPQGKQIDCTEPTESHRMGLDKEEIDQDAYREFMRGL